jgi:hypothetical protein
MNGCISFSTERPPADPGFAQVYSLDTYEGCYLNQGEGPRGAGIRLSDLLWPGELSTQTVDAISVTSPTARLLEVAAVAGGKVVRTRRYELDTDISLESGQLKLHPKYSTGDAGDVFLGLYRKQQTLGLDREGNGRVEHRATIVGLAYAIWPALVSERVVNRFDRVEALCPKPE